MFNTNLSQDQLEIDRAALNELADRLRAAAVVDLSLLSPRETAVHVSEMVVLHEQLARLIGVVMRVAEQSQTHLANGQKSMTALLRATTHIPTSQAVRYKTAADAVDRFPTFAQAFADEQVTLGHLEVMTGLLSRANSEQVMNAEPQLCALAVLCTTEEFRDKIKEWEAVADPTEHLDDYIRAQATEHLWYGKDLFGNLHFSGTYSPANGEQFLQGVDRRSDQLWRQEQELAKHNKGCPNRTPMQRRATALLELVIDGSSTPAGSKRPEPLIEIIMTDPGTCTCDDPEPSNEPDSDTLKALKKLYSLTTTGQHNPLPDADVPLPSPSRVFPQTLDGKLIPHQIVAELAQNGKIRTTLIKPDGNPLHDPVLDSRDFTERQKRHIRLRDRKCQHHGCTSPARYCEYDHNQPHAKDGPTTVTNGQLLCKFHHKWKHREDPKPQHAQPHEPVDEPDPIQRE